MKPRCRIRPFFDTWQIQIGNSWHGIKVPPVSVSGEKEWPISRSITVKNSWHDQSRMEVSFEGAFDFKEGEYVLIRYGGINLQLSGYHEMWIIERIDYANKRCLLRVYTDGYIFHEPEDILVMSKFTDHERQPGPNQTKDGTPKYVCSPASSPGVPRGTNPGGLGEWGEGLNS